jgi:stress response protein YsnF
MKTIIAMYMDEKTADEAARDLASAGFDRGSMSVATGDPGEAHRGSLLGALSGRGVGRDRAELYSEGVRRGASLVMLDADDSRTEEGVRILDRHGSIDIDRAADRWRQEGWSSYDERAGQLSAADLESERGRFAHDTMDVVQEEVKVGKRAVQRGGVRVHTYVTERPVSRDVELREEQVRVEREPAGERISPAEAEQAFSEGEQEFVVAEHGEEAVVQKEARVVERVRVDTEEETRTEHVEDTERRRDVEVERTDRPGGR